MSHLARSCRFACLMLLLGGVIASSRPSQAQPPPPPAPTIINGQAPAMMPATSSLEMFQPRDVQLTWHDRRWLLVHQGHTLKDFGPRVEEARLALRLIHELGLNQHAVIGSPVPHIEYWLVDGHAPGALPRSGMHTFPIDPARLRVEQVQDQWCIRDANRVLFNFVQYADEARQALAALQKHHFTQVGFVGQVTPSMIVFGRSGGEGEGDTPAMRATHGASATGRQFAQPKFPRPATNADGSPRIEPMKTTHVPGYEGVVQPLVPPLIAPANVRANTSGETATLGNLRSVAWHSQPQFGNQQRTQAMPEGRQVFDWRQVQVRQENGIWKLVAGSQILASFGTNLQQSQMALAAIRYYRFTESNVGGDSSPYFLANGAAPRGLMLGLQGPELQVEKLAVQHQSAGYAICQGSQVVLQFRDLPEPARQALETIQRLKLDRLCHIGEQGKDGMTILVRSR